jgi:hypothetical protein
MAGSQLVRYFLNKHENKNKSATLIDRSNSDTNHPKKEQSHPPGDDDDDDCYYYLSHFQAVAFTDSNHNINWSIGSYPLSQTISKDHNVCISNPTRFIPILLIKKFWEMCIMIVRIGNIDLVPFILYGQELMNMP